MFPTAPRFPKPRNTVFHPDHLGGGAAAIIEEKLGRCRPGEAHTRLRPQLVVCRARCGDAPPHLSRTPQPDPDGHPGPPRLLQPAPRTHVSGPSHRLQRPLIRRFPHRSTRRAPLLPLYSSHLVESKLPAPSIASGYRSLDAARDTTRTASTSPAAACLRRPRPRYQDTRHICSCQEFSYQGPSKRGTASRIASSAGKRESGLRVLPTKT